MTNQQTVLTTEEFRQLARLGKTLAQKIFTDGTGPRCVRIGRKRMILRETAMQWLRDREEQGRAA